MAHKNIENRIFFFQNCVTFSGQAYHASDVIKVERQPLGTLVSRAWLCILLFHIQTLSTHQMNREHL